MHPTAAVRVGAPPDALTPLPIDPDAIPLVTERAMKRQREFHTDSSVWSHVADRAQTDGDRAAMVAGDVSVSYRALARRVGEIQAVLLGLGCVSGDRVAVAGPRSVDTVAAFLAIESLGAAYLPVDPHWPEARTAQILNRAAPRCVFVLGESPPSLSGSAVPLVSLPPGGAPTAPALLARVVQDDEHRYVIHTSGSSGRPKGTIVSQAGFMNHLWSMVEVLRLDATDRVAFSAPPTYVIAVWQMLAVLLVGGTVVVIDETETRFAKRLLSSVERHGVTVLELVPTIVGWIVDHLRRTPAAVAMPRLRCLISTGEKLHVALAAGVFDTLPEVSFYNAYGSTECSDDVSIHLIRSADLALPRLPIGTPIPNAVLYLLVCDQGSWRAAEPGEVGEIWVGGTPVACGYVADSATTRDAFFTDPLDPGSRTGRLYRTRDLARLQDGMMFLLGRADRQVKIAGVRIELDDVESAISRIPDVAWCAVVMRENHGREELAAYYHCERDEITPSQLSASAGALLPSAMVPRSWIRVDSIPRNGSDKTDYGKLGSNRHTHTT